MKHMTFNHKMIRFISWTLIIATIIIILVSGLSAIISVTDKSTQMAMKEAEVMAANMEDNFEQYQGLIWSVVLDNHIQHYLKNQGNPYDSVDNAYSVLDDLCNMWSNINFITIIPGDGTGYLSKGKAIPNWMPGYTKRLKQDYDAGIRMRNSAMKMSFTKEFSKKENYTLNIYYPLYSNEVLGQRLGMLCVNLNDANFLLLLSNGSGHVNFVVDSYLIHEEGQVIVSTDWDKIGIISRELDLTKKAGTAITWRDIAIHKKLNNWDFHYVIHISWRELLKESMRTVVILLLLLTLILFLIIPLSGRMVTRAYEPWGNVVKAMEKVSEGNLDTRLAAMESAPDMKVVSQGFNGMMEQLIKLMEQVKEEQFQMDQIRLAALQSQIQPHFLYNTLDCIHWQAVVDGNKDISGMVKVLASYYRTCLSKGKDIITIEEELEQTRNYLYIQKIRYDEILNYEISFDADLNQAIIPKLTLQPLVENAIYHGIKRIEDKKGQIVIRVTGNEKDIYIEVEDNGAGMSDEKLAEMKQMISMQEEEFGYGVRNVNRRLQLYFGQKYGLEYDKNRLGGVTVRVWIPNAYDLKGRHIVI